MKNIILTIVITVLIFFSFAAVNAYHDEKKSTQSLQHQLDSTKTDGQKAWKELAVVRKELELTKKIFLPDDTTKKSFGKISDLIILPDPKKRFFFPQGQPAKP